MYFHKQSGSESESRPESETESGSEIKVNAGSEKKLCFHNTAFGDIGGHI